LGAQTSSYERFVHPVLQRAPKYEPSKKREPWLALGRSSGTTNGYVDGLRRLRSALAQKRSPLIAQAVARRKTESGEVIPIIP
jgi:hypothetical protein